jgi:predicted kinase
MSGAPVPVWVVSGAPASGKSTLARELARRRGAVLLDLDVLTAPLTAVVAGLLEVDDLDAGPLAQHSRAARYETLQAVAVDNVRLGLPAVLVAPFSSERRDQVAWSRFTAPLAAAGGVPQLVWLRIPGAVLLERMTARAADRDRTKLTEGLEYLSRADLAPPSVPHTAVDALASTEDQLTAVDAGSS